jgi:hypothetical protein
MVVDQDAVGGRGKVRGGGGGKEERRRRGEEGRTNLTAKKFLARARSKATETKAA